MNKKELEKSTKIISDLCANYESIRAFARDIAEDPADIIRWKAGKIKIKVRAVVRLAQMFDIKPHDLRPDWFPKELEFVFHRKN